MLQRITIDGQLSWICPGSDDEPCGQRLSARLEDVTYCTAASGRAVQLVEASTGCRIHDADGAVIALPPCRCGMQTFLKADYSSRDFQRRRIFAEHCDEAGVVQLRVLKTGHARNLILQHLLYARGLAPCAPVLPMVPGEVSNLLNMMELGLLSALWFTFYLLAGSEDTEHFGRYILACMDASQRLPGPAQVQSLERL